MATRFYVPSSGAADVSPNFSGTWDATGDAHRYKAVKTKLDTAFVVMTHYGAAGIPPFDAKVLSMQYVTGQLANYNFSASDTIKIQIRCAEAAENRNLSLYSVIRVVSEDGGTFRGTLFDGGGATPLEFDTGGYQNRNLGGGAVNVAGDVSMQNGDRIVIEIGIFANQSTYVGDWIGGDIVYGDDDAANDLAENQSSYLAYNAWIEFSPTIADYSAAATNIMLNII